MKEVRRIKFTGKNLNDIFFLPCVSKIYKRDGNPMPFIYPYMLLECSGLNYLLPNAELVEYDNGKWNIDYPCDDEGDEDQVNP
jgi:hypothetical protein